MAEQVISRHYFRKRGALFHLTLYKNQVCKTGEKWAVKQEENAQTPLVMMPGQKEGKQCKPHLQGRYPLLGVTWVLY